MASVVAAPGDDRSREEFRSVLAELGFRNYAEYLASPLWRSIRQRVYEAKGDDCQVCGVSRAVEINHERYDRNTLTGKTLKYLVPVCRHCHEVYHGDVLWAPERDRWDDSGAPRRPR